MATNYSATFHAWRVALKRYGVTVPVFGGFLTRGTDFDGGRNVEEEDWEGHTGTDSIIIQSDRTSMGTEPEYDQAVCFGEGVEDNFAMAIGLNADGTTTQSSPAEGVNVYTFSRNVGNYLPPATIINSYHATDTDARIYDNAFMNELTLTIDDNNPKFSCKYIADADIINQPNQDKLAGKSYKLNKGQIRVYLYDYSDGLTLSSFKEQTEEQLELHEFECAKSIELTINNNFEESDCINTAFGKNSADKGAFEVTGSMELKWNPNLKINDEWHYGSAVIEDKWLTGKKNGARPVSDSLFQTLVLVAEDGNIMNKDADGEYTVDTGVSNKFIIIIPKVEIKEPETTLSGDENKSIQFDYEMRTDASLNSPIDVEVTTGLSELHFGETVTYGTNGIFESKEESLAYFESLIPTTP